MRKYGQRQVSVDVSKQTKEIVRRSYENAKRSTEEPATERRSRFLGEEFLARI